MMHLKIFGFSKSRRSAGYCKLIILCTLYFLCFCACVGVCMLWTLLPDLNKYIAYIHSYIHNKVFTWFVSRLLEIDLYVILIIRFIVILFFLLYVVLAMDIFV